MCYRCYVQASCLKPFHIVLQAFPKLPSQAAHVLFNNFVGVVLQHTDQPYSFSGKIVQSVLTLIAMVSILQYTTHWTFIPWSQCYALLRLLLVCKVWILNY